MKRILHLIRKEFWQLRRDKRMLAVVFFPPVMQLILLGYAATMDVEDVRLVVCDLDETAVSRELVEEFSASEYFTPVGFVSHPREIDSYLDNGRAIMALSVPKGFANNIVSGEGARLQLLVDGSDANSAGIAMSYASSIVARYSGRIMIGRIEPATKKLGRRIGKIVAEPRVWYNQDLKSRNFMVPAVLALLLMVMTTSLTSMAIVKEREIGTLEQLIVTPIRSYEFIAGKLAPFILIGFVDVLLVTFVATVWFGIPLRGSIFHLLGLGGVFLFTTLGIGLLMSTVSQTQQQAMMTSMFFVMMPMIVLSGFIFPIENMPKIFQFVTYGIPLRYFLVIVRSVFLKGVDFSVLWPQVWPMLTIGVAVFAFGVMRFRKHLG
ncbi:MAG: ABC transporter permease [Bacteroidota bacterium]